MMEFKVLLWGLLSFLSLVVLSEQSDAKVTCKKDPCLSVVQSNRNQPSSLQLPGCTSYFRVTVVQSPTTKTNTKTSTAVVTTTATVTGPSPIRTTVTSTHTITSTVVTGGGATTTTTTLTSTKVQSSTTTYHVTETQSATTTVVAMTTSTSTELTTVGGNAAATTVTTTASIVRRDDEATDATAAPDRPPKSSHHHGHKCQSTSAKPSTIPAYASACSNSVAYSSACSCVGAPHNTVTAKRCTIVHTTTSTATRTATRTSYAHPTVTKTSTVSTTTTTTVAGGKSRTVTQTTHTTVTSTSVVAKSVTDTTTATSTVYSTSTVVETTTSTVTLPNGPTQTCGNEGFEWASYPNPFGDLDPPDPDYAAFDPTYFKTQQPQEIGLTPELGFGYGTEHPYGANDTYDSYFVFDHRGYVFAQEAGQYTFTIPGPDDISIIWVGQAAYEGWTRDNANLITTYYDHDNYQYQYFVANPNTYIPFRLMYGNAQGGGTFQFSVQDPNGNYIFDGDTGYDQYAVAYSCDLTTAPPFPPFGTEI